MTRFAKIRHNGAFLEIQIFASVSSVYLELCAVALPMLYCNTFWVTRLNSKRSNTLALYTFLRRLMFHVFNYTIITYVCFNIERPESLMMKESWYPVHLHAWVMTILLHLCYLNKNFYGQIIWFNFVKSNSN